MANDIVSHEFPIVTRAEARALGLSRYFTGKPCIRGHISERYTKSICVECQKENAKKADPVKHLERSIRWAKENPDRVRENKAKWHQKNKKKCNDASKKWHEINPERSNLLKKRWSDKNPLLVSTYRHNRRALLKNCEGSYTSDEIRELLEKQKWKCANPACNKSLKNKYHIDHIKPLSCGGSNWITNIQMLCPRCNLKKYTKDPIEWAQENGFLL